MTNRTKASTRGGECTQHRFLHQIGVFTARLLHWWRVLRRRLWREERSHALLALDLLERPPLGARSSRLLARRRGAAARPWFGLGELGLGLG